MLVLSLHVSSVRRKHLLPGHNTKKIPPRPLTLSGEAGWRGRDRERESEKAKESELESEIESEKDGKERPEQRAGGRI